MRAKIIFAALVGGSFIACGSSEGGEGQSDESAQAAVSAAPECVAVEGPLPVGTGSGAMAGEFHLTMVAATGDHGGERVEGMVTFRATEGDAAQLRGPNDEVSATTVVPFHGTGEIQLENVGALRLGDLDSTDPSKPGLAVLERTDEPGIIVRVGSQTNDRSNLLFDGGFTVLRVFQVSDQGFAGSWASGASGEASGGYFCAHKQEA